MITRSPAKRVAPADIPVREFFYIPRSTDDSVGTHSNTFASVGAPRGACFRYWVVVDATQVHRLKVAEDRSWAVAKTLELSQLCPPEATYRLKVRYLHGPRPIEAHSEIAMRARGYGG